MTNDNRHEIVYNEKEHSGRLYAQVTDNGIELAAPDATDALMTASTAARLAAENLAGRYGEESDVVSMFVAASRFASETVKFDSVRDTEPNHPPARGQFVDVLLLAQASAFTAQTLRRDHNSGGDPDDYQHAAEVMADIWDGLIRSMGIKAIGGQMEQTDHRYEGHEL
jgi:hypothetical protein